MKRRQFIQTVSAASAGALAFPYINCGENKVDTLVTRPFGNLDFDVTTFALGGQASIQWTADDIDPVAIILKAFKSGVNYFDTSNLYGPSQYNFHKAFKELSLIPGQAGYNQKLRETIWLTSKTHLRLAKSSRKWENVGNWTNGKPGSHTIDDLKRSLSFIFGDGQGNYPKGAYLDMVLIHSVSSFEDIDAVYEGLAHPDPQAEEIGALAALRDYRDGSNLTGLNPGEEKLIRHIGFSGHRSPALMMEMIQRDQFGVLDGMLIAINANDKQKFNMQHNAIPVADAKGMGIIGMKVFADGAMYTKEATWSREPKHVVRTVGSDELPSRRLIEYSLSVPGVHTNIIGIGRIDDDPKHCQLMQNISASQIGPQALSETDMQSIEAMAALVKEGNTNYFQNDKQPLLPPQQPRVKMEKIGSETAHRIEWNNAFAADHALDVYKVFRNNELIATIPHTPQIDQTPFHYLDKNTDERAAYKVVVMDKAGKSAETKELTTA